ncbi:MAG: GIY-YIG nuclease family protein [Flavobacterium sp.]|nr:MAG: GIY-YIG nuclease family protein [Flavobacterium sp.]
MEINIKAPSREDILSSGIVVVPAINGASWRSIERLGAFAHRSGVYIHHCNGEILYVGQTTRGGQWGTFGERNRRHFQLKASGNSKHHQRLCAQKHPIMVCMFDLDMVDQMVQTSLPFEREHKALMLEQLFIGMYRPIGNSDRISQKLRRRGQGDIDGDSITQL